MRSRQIQSQRPTSASSPDVVASVWYRHGEKRRQRLNEAMENASSATTTQTDLTQTVSMPIHQTDRRYHQARCSDPLISNVGRPTPLLWMVVGMVCASAASTLTSASPMAATAASPITAPPESFIRTSTLGLSSRLLRGSGNESDNNVVDGIQSSSKNNTKFNSMAGLKKLIQSSPPSSNSSSSSSSGDLNHYHLNSLNLFHSTSEALSFYDAKYQSREMSRVSASAAQWGTWHNEWQSLTYHDMAMLAYDASPLNRDAHRAWGATYIGKRKIGITIRSNSDNGIHSTFVQGTWNNVSSISQNSSETLKSAIVDHHSSTTSSYNFIESPSSFLRGNQNQQLHRHRQIQSWTTHGPENEPPPGLVASQYHESETKNGENIVQGISKNNDDSDDDTTSSLYDDVGSASGSNTNNNASVQIYN